MEEVNFSRYFSLFKNRFGEGACCILAIRNPFVLNNAIYLTFKVLNF